MTHRNVPNPPPGFDDLPADEQLEYVQSLWERVAASPDAVGFPAWHTAIVRERLAAYEANPAECRDWDEIRSALRAQLKPDRDR